MPALEPEGHISNGHNRLFIIYRDTYISPNRIKTYNRLAAWHFCKQEIFANFAM